MRCDKFFLFLICILLIGNVSAQLRTGYESNTDLTVGLTKPIQPINVTTGSQVFNMSDIWVTDEGLMDNVPDLYPTLDIRYLELDGSNFFTDSLIDYDNSLFNFSINKSVLDSTIEVLGYNHTSNLTKFYDLRYLTGELSLFFYNNSDSFNSSYTIMNTTIPSGADVDVDRYTSMGDGDNLLTKRILSTLNLSILEKSAYNQHTTIDFISGTKDVQLKSTLHILYANGTETQIGSSPVSEVLVSGIYQQIIWTGTIDTDTLFNSSGGDYLTMYLYAVVSGSGSAPTIDLIVADNTAGRLDIGINPTDIRINEIDPFAIHKSGDVIWEGNDNHGGFNITNVGTLLGNISSNLIQVNHIGEKDSGHNIVFDNRIEADSGIFSTSGIAFADPATGTEPFITGSSNELQFTPNGNEGGTNIFITRAGVDDIILYPNTGITADLGRNFIGIWRDLWLSGDANIGGDVKLNSVGANIISATNAGGDLRLGAGGGTNDLQIETDGDVKIFEDLEVVGDVIVTGNVSGSTGFFTILGNLISRITTLFVKDININGTISNPNGNVVVDDSMNVSGFINGVKFNTTSNVNEDIMNIFLNGYEGDNKANTTIISLNQGNVSISPTHPSHFRMHGAENGLMNSGTQTGEQWSVGNGEVQVANEVAVCDGEFYKISLSCRTSSTTGNRVNISIGANGGVVSVQPCGVTSEASNGFTATSDCSSTTFNEGDYLTFDTIISDGNANVCTVFAWGRCY